MQREKSQKCFVLFLLFNSTWFNISNMRYYKTHINALPGTNWKEVMKKAFGVYRDIVRKTKRRPYVRSAYFDKQKIFLGIFWQHLHEKKNLKDKTRRLKYFPCAIELIKKSRVEPISKENPNRTGEIVHRFAGSSPNNELFFVQIKEVKRTGEKWLISVFPLDD